MDLYTMGGDFGTSAVIDEFISAIWTERYSEAGEFTLEVEATPYNAAVLAENKFLGLVGSAEVMIIETASLKDGILTCTGTDLLGFLEQRMMWHADPFTEDVSQRVVDWVIEGNTPEAAISQVVFTMVGNLSSLGMPNNAGAGLDWSMEFIEGLVTTWDAGGTEEDRITFPIGTLYNAIRNVAQTYGVGIKLYLNAPGDPPDLTFHAYRGVDRSSNQATYPLVRLSPELDNISDVAEVRSIKEWKNVCYVYYNGEVSKHVDLGAYPVALGGEPTGFNRRVLLTNAEGEPPGHKVRRLERYSPGNTGWYEWRYGPEIIETDEEAFRAQNAKDALANHNYIHALDGEVAPDGQKFGVDYNLGDIIELESPHTGFLQQARVTEHIRSEDANGEKEYPTISII